MSRFILFFLLFQVFEALPVRAEDADSMRDILKYGTDNEISELIKTLKKDKTDYMDADLEIVAHETQNSAIKALVMSFFSEREKKGLESDAIAIIENRNAVEADSVITAIDYLGKVKYAESQDAIRRVADSGEERYVAAAIRAIGYATNPENSSKTAEYLIQYYENKNPTDDIQREIITALGETKSVSSIPFISGIIESNERPVLTMAALGAAAKISDDTLKSVIIGASVLKDPNVRSAAIDALGSFNGEEVEKTILDAFRDSYYRTRLAAVKASGTRKITASVPYLNFRAEKDTVPAVREEAVRSLGQIGDEQCAAAIEKIFDDKKTPDKLKAVSAEMLLKINADAYAEKIISMLDDAKRLNQKQLYNGLITAISKAKTAKIKPLVVRLYSSKDAADKVYALELTDINGFNELSPEVRKLADEKNSGIARKAQDILNKIENGSTAD